MFNYLFRFNRKILSAQFLTIATFGLLTGWVISLPYDGPVFYAYMAGSKGDFPSINHYNLFFLATGLFSGIFISRLPFSQVRLSFLLIAGCFLSSLIIPLLPMGGIIFLLPLLSFISGMAMTSNGHLIRNYIGESRWPTAAPLIMLVSCFVIIGAHILVTWAGFTAGFVFIETALFLSCVSLLLINKSAQPLKLTVIQAPVQIARKFWILFVFIFLITINAGLMFQAVFPAFAEYRLLSSVYTNLPYVAAIIICYRICRGNKSNLLYGALALWGFAFLAFNYLAVTPLSFFIVITCMLFAAGILDLFWWTIMTTSFGYVKNPLTMFGAILSVNVFGSWVGGIVIDLLSRMHYSSQEILIIGMPVVLICSVLIAPMNKQLASVVKSNDFLDTPPQDKEENTEPYPEKQLSSRELEVFDQLLEGLQDKEISSRLNISLHTVKSHNRKIYQKLEVKNRSELRRMFNQNSDPP